MLCITEAYDSVNYWKLFNKLLDDGIDVAILLSGRVTKNLCSLAEYTVKQFYNDKRQGVICVICTVYEGSYTWHLYFTTRWYSLL